MRPISLEINSFGPYAGHQVIDFRELKGRNLFLICGPTGSGKTTVLDAMCYALYGNTSGNDRLVRPCAVSMPRRSRRPPLSLTFP